MPHVAIKALERLQEAGRAEVFCEPSLGGIRQLTSLFRIIGQFRDCTRQGLGVAGRNKNSVHAIRNGFGSSARICANPRQTSGCRLEENSRKSVLLGRHQKDVGHLRKQRRNIVSLTKKKHGQAPGEIFQGCPLRPVADHKERRPRQQLGREVPQCPDGHINSLQGQQNTDHRKDDAGRRDAQICAHCAASFGRLHNAIMAVMDDDAPRADGRISERRPKNGAGNANDPVRGMYAQKDSRPA